MKGLRFHASASVFLLAAFLAGCIPLRDQNKSQSSTVASPKDDADWSATTEAGMVAAYLTFLNKHPLSQHRSQAIKAAADILQKGHDKEEDYASFLSKLPENEHAPAVRRGLERVRARAALEGHDLDGCSRLFAGYGHAAGAGSVRAVCAKLEFEAAKKMGTRLAFDFFLQRFPESAHAAEARSLLAALPRGSAPQDDGDSLELLPKIRSSSPDLRAEECNDVLADAVRAFGDAFGSGAEKVRDQFSGYIKTGAPPQACANRPLVVASTARPMVGAAVRALALVYQRQARLANDFSLTEAVAAKARVIGKTASELAEQAESFDLEMQAYYGFMPADPDKPHEKAASDAKEAERRAHAAFDTVHSGVAGAEKDAAAEVLRLMDDEQKLLIRIIAYYERVDRKAE